MKIPFVLLAVLSLGLTSASAVVMQLPDDGTPPYDVPKNGTGESGGNGATAADNFARLQDLLATLSDPSLPAPIFDGFLNFSSNEITDDQLLGFEYAVLHYGVGPGGTSGSGGGVAFYYITGGVGNYTFPNPGLGPNGFGGFSGGTLFNSDAETGNIPPPGPGVPDGGVTIALLGLGLLGLGGLSRLVKK